MTQISFGVAMLLAALPWLVPFTTGPSAAVVPWLASAACGIAIFSVAVATGRGKPDWPMLAICAILSWCAVFTASSMQTVVALLSGLALMATTACATRDAGVADAVHRGLLLAAVLSAIAGLIQYLGFAASFGPWINFAHAGEAFANLRQTNHFATLCWLGVSVVVFDPQKLTLRTSVLLVLLMSAAAASSASRTGLVEGVVVVGAALVWRDQLRPRRATLSAFACAGYIAGAVLLPLLLEAVLGALPERTLWGRIGEGANCSSRTVLWSNVAHLIWQRPLTGWGWGELDYAHFMARYPGQRFCDILDNAHNLPLHLAVELGVPVALAVCVGGLVWTFRRRPLAEHAPARQLAWTVLALITLHSLLEYPLWYGPFQIAFGAAIGRLSPERTWRSFAVPARSGSFVSVVLAAWVGFAAWDYWRVSQVYFAPEQRAERWRRNPLAASKRAHLFAQQARFAELTLSTVTSDNATFVAALAHEMLHYSPEPRVVTRLIEAETMRGNDAEAVLVLARFRAAFPNDYEAWRRSALSRNTGARGHD